MAICANIFIPAFEFIARSEPQNDRILDYISEIDWHDSDLLKSKGFDCDGETGTYADDDKFSIHVADATSYDKAEIVSEYKIFIMSIFRICQIHFLFRNCVRAIRS